MPRNKKDHACIWKRALCFQRVAVGFARAGAKPHLQPLNPYHPTHRMKAPNVCGHGTGLRRSQGRRICWWWEDCEQRARERKPKNRGIRSAGMRNGFLSVAWAFAAWAFIENSKSIATTVTQVSSHLQGDSVVWGASGTILVGATVQERSGEGYHHKRGHPTGCVDLTRRGAGRTL